MEDLMVSVADKAWKNKRVPEMEDLMAARMPTSQAIRLEITPLADVAASVPANAVVLIATVYDAVVVTKPGHLLFGGSTT